jgi:hypothetical protein
LGVDPADAALDAAALAALAGLAPFAAGDLAAFAAVTACGSDVAAAVEDFRRRFAAEGASSSSPPPPPPRARRARQWPTKPARDSGEPSAATGLKGRLLEWGEGRGEGGGHKRQGHGSISSPQTGVAG